MELLEPNYPLIGNKFNMKRYAYGQVGADLLINQFLQNKETGFYVDVGCNDPEIYSNTRFFYEKGWHGLAIDAIDKKAQWADQRPRDTFVQEVVGNGEEVTFNYFKEDALSTINQSVWNEKCGYGLDYSIKVKTKPLSQILEEHNVSWVDLLCVDVEGHDLEALQTHNWDIMPKMVIVEDYLFGQYKKRTEITDFLLGKGMHKIADTLIDSVFSDDETLRKYQNDHG